MGNTGQGSHTHLELIKSPEAEPMQVQIARAYADQLLKDNNGQPRDLAEDAWTPMRGAEGHPNRATFYTDDYGFHLLFYNTAEPEDVLFGATLTPFENLPGMIQAVPPSDSKDWVVVYGEPGSGAPPEYSFDLHTFTDRLAYHWGELPTAIQLQLGIQTESPDQPRETY